MSCADCKEKPVYKGQDGNVLCKKDFLHYFEKKVLKTIRSYDLLGKKEQVVVAFSGGKDSATVAYIVNKILKKRKQTLIALLIDEGIHGYRDSTIKDAKKFCEKYDIELQLLSFKRMFGFTLDEFIKKHKINPCSVCGVIRRYLMNKGARSAKATRLVTGHNLDDEAQSLMMNQFKGNIQFSAKLGPISGALKHGKFVKKVKPLYFMPEKEVALFAYLMDFPVQFVECPNSLGTFRQEVGKQLNTLEEQFPGTKQGIINSFLDVLPQLKGQYTHKKISSCTSCGEPASKELCKVCELLEKEKQ